MNRNRFLNKIAQSLQGASLILFIGVLYWMREIFVPLALGILVAFLLNPVVRRLQRSGLSNPLSVIATVLLVIMSITGFGFGIGSSLSGFTDELPKYRAELERKVESVRSMTTEYVSKFREKSTSQNAGSDQPSEEKSHNDIAMSKARNHPHSLMSQRQRDLADRDQIATDESETPQSRAMFEAEDWSPDLATWAGSAITVLGPIGTLGLVTVFAIFFLLYRDDLRDRFVSLFSRGNYVTTADALSEASERIARYLLTQLLLNVGFGVVFAAGLFLIGFFLAPDGTFPFIILLGTVAGLVRFVPYVGPPVGAGFPLVLSVILFPGFSIVAAVAGLIIVMELISNNILEPWFYGNSTGVSPVAVIVAAVFWAWLWGPIGLLLATPLTVCAVVIGTHVPRFRFLAMLLSDEMQVPKAVRGYQRLLTGDPFSINEFIKHESKETDVVSLLDETIIPTIKLVIKDHSKRVLTDEQLFMRLREAAIQNGILSADDTPHSGYSRQDSSFKNHAEETARLTTWLADPPARRLQVCSIAASNLGEHLVSEIIGELLFPILDLTMLDLVNFPDRDAERVALMSPDLVLINVMPPESLNQAHYWCSELRRAGYRGEIIVAWFGRTRHFDKLLQGFRKRGANSLVTSARQLCQKLQRLTAKPIPQISPAVA